MGRITKIKLMKIVPMGALDEIEKCHWNLFFEGTKLKLLAAASITEMTGWFLHHQKKTPWNRRRRETSGRTFKKAQNLALANLSYLARPTSIPTTTIVTQSRRQEVASKREMSLLLPSTPCFVLEANLPVCGGDSSNKEICPFDSCVVFKARRTWLLYGAEPKKRKNPWWLSFLRRASVNKNGQIWKVNKLVCLRVRVAVKRWELNKK